MQSAETLIDGRWLGRRLCGVDVDQLLAYQTPKVVIIQDRSLGLLKVFFMLAIVTYVFIIQIWWKGTHFEEDPVEGLSRLQWQHPVANGCNPKDIDCRANYTLAENLPYCNNYTGDSPAEVRKDCEYFDATELPIDLAGGVLIPTYITTFAQARNCSEFAVNRCPLKYKYLNSDGKEQEGTGEAVPTHSAYVADVEDFTVLIDHSFRASSGGVSYDDFNMQGYWKQCDVNGSICTTQPIKCEHDRCQELGMYTGGSDSSLIFLTRRSDVSKARLKRAARFFAKRHAGSLQPEFDTIGSKALPDSDGQKDYFPSSIENGDVFSLRTLLRMAGKSLDEIVMDQQEAKHNARARGTAIVIYIDYHNLKPWTLWKTQDPPEYTISVTSRPVHKYKHTYVSSQTDEGRELKSAYGVFITVQQSGAIGRFDLIHTMVIFTAAMGLLAAANTFTDFLALKVLPKKEVYSSLKYQDSGDLVDDDQK